MSSDETATERLRELLDERGEFYKISGNRTWWGRPIDAQTGKPINVFHNQAQPMGEDRLLVELQLATPEQAIAATLGRETCELEINTDMTAIQCSKCGYVVPKGTDLMRVRYCAGCGRKVVDE